jgi:hypothetical protein
MSPFVVESVEPDYASTDHASIRSILPTITAYEKTPSSEIADTYTALLRALLQYRLARRQRVADRYCDSCGRYRRGKDMGAYFPWAWLAPLFPAQVAFTQLESSFPATAYFRSEGGPARHRSGPNGQPAGLSGSSPRRRRRRSNATALCSMCRLAALIAQASGKECVCISGAG